MPPPIKDRIKDLRRVKASDLIPNPRNWRAHPPAQQKAMAAALEEIGFADAVLARETEAGLELIDGHLRTETVPDEQVPVLVLDVSEDEADKLLATLDPLAAMATTDKDKLNDLIGHLTVSSEELEKVVQGVAARAGILASDDLADDTVDGQSEFEELIGKWKTAVGQKWEIDSPNKKTHHLVCGDATKAEDVKRLFGDATPFLMVTDPPYGVNYDPKWRLRAGLNHSGQQVSAGDVSNDDNASWKAAWDLFPGTVAYVWHGGLHSEEVARDLEASDFEIRSQIIWVKQALTISRGAYHWRHEPCFYASRGTANWAGGPKQSTVWEIDKVHAVQGAGDGEFTFHSTQKPLECMARPIANHGDKADAVYDPFLGSGTTMVAAEQLGRQCFGMEIDPGYLALILERMSGHGCKPRRLDS
tara:strand:- start:1364 stop:2614 length:1251 start_codon:yes stop_codon:yes gene_type:complete